MGITMTAEQEAADRALLLYEHGVHAAMQRAHAELDALRVDLHDGLVRRSQMALALAASTAREAQMRELLAHLRECGYEFNVPENMERVDAALALAPQSQEPLRALLERAATAGWNEGVNRRPVLSSVAAIVSALLPPVGSGGESEGGSEG